MPRQWDISIPFGSQPATFSGRSLGNDLSSFGSSS